jgi:hypothetical protein
MMVCAGLWSAHRLQVHYHGGSMAKKRDKRVEASPRNRRDGVDTLGEVLLVVKGTFAIIALAYLAVSCGG